MDKDYNSLFNRFLELAQNCERFCFITIDVKLKKKSINKLNSFKKEVLNLKKKSISLKKEKYANNLLSIEFMINSILNELNMWLSLEEKEFDKAWDFLIDSQLSCKNSLQSKDDLVLNFEGRHKKLFLLERFLFPHQVFLSPGILVGNSKCSICNKNYDDCEHVVGKAYMGKLCHRILKDVKLNEISIVKEPANKHARVLNFSEKGVQIDKMTFKKKKKK